MPVFKCKMCGGNLEIRAGETVCECEYCGTKQTLPRLDDDRRINLYDRANHFRRNNDFDKAAGIYEQILNEDRTDAEAYWSLVLCQYGIEYVEDPQTHKRVPTVNRAQFTSVFDDENYKSALNYADPLQKAIYEEEAAVINEIQKGILAVSQKEEPFDVFICYKETDENGRRTRDSVLANDLYHALTNEGFKVFYSRITLEDKIGTAYEPYIFAALNTAKVMVVMGTKSEYFNAVWVKNEWSRYLTLVKNSNGKKMLIPAYRDMDPYDLPEEFSHLQAQDMSKLGFMQDLIHGIKKIAATESKPVSKETTVVTGATDIAPLLKRVFLYLEDGEWENADEYCERVLDSDPENAQVYLGKLMAELQCKRIEELKNCSDPFENLNNYQKILRFGDDSLKSKLAEYIKHINERNEVERLETLYNDAVYHLNHSRTKSEFGQVAKDFDYLSDFKDSRDKAQIARKEAAYLSAMDKQQDDTELFLKEAIQIYLTIPGWRDSDEKIIKCKERIEQIKAEKELQQKEEERKAAELERKSENLRRIKRKSCKFAGLLIAVIIIIASIRFCVLYNNARKLYDEGNYFSAAVAFDDLGLHGRSRNIWNEVTDRNTISAGSGYLLAIKSDGTVIAAGRDNYDQCEVSDWENVISVSTGSLHSVGLKSNGTVVAVGNNKNEQCNTSNWRNIINVAAGGSFTVGLKADGTLVAVGSNTSKQCDISTWQNIISVSAGVAYTIGLKSDGTVVAVGNNDSGQCDVSEWEHIVAVSAGGYHTVGLKSDGTVVATGKNENGQCSISEWEDINSISAGIAHTVGLRSDGTVFAVGNNYVGQCDVSGWQDIVAVSAGEDYTIGLKSNGSIVIAGKIDDGQEDLSNFVDILVAE